MAITNDFLIRVLILGVILICAQIALQMKWYNVKVWKSIPLGLLIVLFGLVSSYIWFFVENLEFSGRSLYGAVFLCPVFLFPVAKCLRVDYGEVMDFSGPAGCLVLGLAKFQCMRDGCCGGKVLFLNEDLIWARFPSQIVEFFVFVIIAFLLLVLSRNIRLRRQIYPLAMIIYGAARFVLNFFRDVEQNYLFGLSQGAFWSVCSLFIGAFVLLWMNRTHLSKWFKKSA